VKLFLSYRRADTQVVATYTAERLALRRGIERVFLDVHEMKGGENWRRQIEDTLDAVDATLVLIGPAWRGEHGEGVRLDDPDDPVRHEVGLALQSGKPVYVALVDGTAMPGTSDVPSELSELVSLHAWELRSARLRKDVDAISEELVPRPSSSPVGQRLLGALIGMAGSAGALLVAALVHRGIFGQPLEQSLGGLGVVVLLIGSLLVAGAFVGMAVRARAR